MICKDCESGHFWYGRRGHRYDTGHWYRREFARPEDYEVVCKLTPWLKITIFAMPRSLPFNKQARFVLLLGNDSNVDQHSRIEMLGTDLNEAKRRALELAHSACVKAAEFAAGLLPDIPKSQEVMADTPGLKRLRKAIEKAEAVLAKAQRREVVVDL